jgi:hypothetical protein
MVREFVALHLAQFFAINMDLDVEMIHKRATSMRIDFRKIEDGGGFSGLETNSGTIKPSWTRYSKNRNSGKTWSVFT